MPRYRLTLAYRGTNYHGWQQQPHLPSYKGETPAAGHGIPTIQETVQRAIARVVNHRVTVVGSSRTDAGVHAKAQIAHFDTDQTQIPLEGLRQGVNSKLPPDIIIRDIAPAADTFDAIACTLRKRYQYYIWNAPDRSVFFNDLAWHRWKHLNLWAMRDAAAVLVGEHDFASFARPGHGRDTTVRTIFSLDVSWRGPKVVIAVEGSGFLWQMVRIIVGTLVEVGIARSTPADVQTMLDAKTRTAAGPTAPPHGLYLQWIQTRESREDAPRHGDTENTENTENTEKKVDGG